MRRRSGIFGIGFIVVLIVAMTFAWLGYDPMVLERMGETRAADTVCAGGVVASTGVIRETPVLGTRDAADLDFAFNVLNNAPTPCLAVFEAMFFRNGKSDFLKGERIVTPGATLEISIPLGRYTWADAAADRLPQGIELKVTGRAPKPAR